MADPAAIGAVRQMARRRMMQAQAAQAAAGAEMGGAPGAMPGAGVPGAPAARPGLAQLAPGGAPTAARQPAMAMGARMRRRKALGAMRRAPQAPGAGAY